MPVETFPADLHAGITDTADPNHVQRPGGMDAWILNLTVAGSGRVGRGNGMFRTDSGRMLLWPPAVPQDYGAAGGRWTHLWVYFTPRPAWLELLAWHDAGGGVLTLDLAGHALRPRIESLFRELIDTARGRLPRRIALALAQLEALLLWCDAANPEAGTARLDPRVHAALDHASARLDRRLAVAALARVAGLSPSRFAHLFRAQLGVTPLAHLERLRIDRARELLLMTGRSVADIGEACGFPDPTWFARVFRRHAGMTPRAYRQGGGGWNPGWGR